MDVPAVLAGEMKDRDVERCKDEPMVDCNAEKECIGDLLIAVETLEERVSQIPPVGSDRLIPVAGLFFESFEHRCRVAHTQFTDLGICEEAQDAGFGECAERPLKAGCVEPLRGGFVMNMCLVQQSDDGVNVQQVNRRFKQDRPPRAARRAPA